ncbi:uncharacterized protein MYCFIDRAFT_179578 [Pseudocercospora fijiensis CIRAD86]|uniref:DUF7730 domain-containing protein n=1 Tax=Pseudocercospora fijiensis (strain CIRAD86) TaxID=383855 RepID=M2ZG67_PSEFD|nr:uncharacterized protein MYCFIDRAFT_179578 [Pseudocercospora fijiensis CIRAD86]EME78134.1 hypothetical protein MYCFIDRAFT_179578 [Pseudocercospora fijiensis CIRAD86]
MVFFGLGGGGDTLQAVRCSQKAEEEEECKHSHAHKEYSFLDFRRKQANRDFRKAKTGLEEGWSGYAYKEDRSDPLSPYQHRPIKQWPNIPALGEMRAPNVCWREEDPNTCVGISIEKDSHSLVSQSMAYESSAGKRTITPAFAQIRSSYRSVLANSQNPGTLITRASNDQTRHRSSSYHELSMGDTAETEQGLQARKQLRKELEPHIDVLYTTRGEPSFTLSELIVCAIVFQDEKYATADNIAGWITKACSFYAHQAIDKYMAALVRQREDPYEGVYVPSLSFPISGFRDAMKEYDLPLEVLETDSSTDSTNPGNANYSTRPRRRIKRPALVRQQIEMPRYTISAGPARVYLRHWLNPPRAGHHFRFFELPPELRNRIYKMLFVYDEEAHLATKRKLVLPAPIPRHRVTLPNLERNENLDKCRENTARMLALIATCKQARHEGRGIFYSLNTFYYEGLAALGSSLLKSSGVSLDMLRRLSLSVDFLPRTRGWSRSDSSRISWVRQSIAGVQLLGQLRLDKLVLFQASCPAYSTCRSRSHHLDMVKATRADDDTNTLFTVCLNAIVAAAKRAKHVKVYPYGGCNALEQYIHTRLKEAVSVKMLCCSFPKYREDDMLFL